MDGANEGRATRASKRRRISPPTQASPHLNPTRSTSPDELASAPHTPFLNSRRGSEHSTATGTQTAASKVAPTIAISASESNEPRRPSFSPVSDDSSPDELDHTASEDFHAFYRNNESYRPASFSNRDAAASFSAQTQPPSPLTPAYSRISTPVRSPSVQPSAPQPEKALRAAVFRPYRIRGVLRGNKKGVSMVKFSRDGRFVASAGADATVRVWDLKTQKCIRVMEGHLAGISALAWSPDGKTIATGADDKAIWLWNVATGKPHPKPLLGHAHYIYSIAFSPKGNMLVSGSYDEAVIIWDVRSRLELRRLPAHSDPVGGVDFTRDGTLIVSCAGDGLIRIWDTSTGQCLRTLVHEDNAPVTSVCFSPNGKYVLAWTLDSCLRLWNYVDGRCMKTYQGHKNEKYSLSGAFGIYGEKDEAMTKAAFVVSGSEDGCLIWWDVNSKHILDVQQGHDGVVLAVDTRDDGILVTGGLDHLIRVWERTEAQDSMKMEDVDVANNATADTQSSNLDGGQEVSGDVDYTEV